DQDATGSSFRTLGFPTMAISVANENGAPVSRVHIAWAARSQPVSNTYACLSPTNTPADCDARIVMSTLNTKTGKWSGPTPVDPYLNLDPNVPTADGQPGANAFNPTGRGHQVQPAVTFAAGKLLITWLDQRFDHTELDYKCPSAGSCTNVTQLKPQRIARGNLDPQCSVDTSGPPWNAPPLNDPKYDSLKALLNSCNQPDKTVWTTFITDGTPGLVRRHTLDVFAATAAPSDSPAFTSRQVSKYAFG